ncbi:MAG: hypothetical protein OXF05_08245 [Hyphomicrobiales bacterium]|nr:hypothetical protein [Hyphomicrobiales bacterium]
MNQTIQEQPRYVMIVYPDTSKEKEINEEAFIELKAKDEVLKILWLAENHYASIGQAYKNFEMSLFEISFDYNHCALQDDRRIGWLGQQKIHVSLMALLNTIHTYINSLRNSYVKDLKELTKSSEKITQKDINDIENQFACSCDTRLEYRIMQALRNFITHAPYADVQGILQIKFEREDINVNGSPRRTRNTSNPAIIIDTAIRDRKFKKDCEDDFMLMKQTGCDRFDIKFMLRGYIEEVAKIHDMFRKKTESLLDDILTDLRTIGRENLSESKTLRAIRIIKLTSKASDGEDFTIGYENISSLKDRRQDWKKLGQEQIHYYSSAIISENKRYPQKDSRLWIVE